MWSQRRARLQSYFLVNIKDESPGVKPHQVIKKGELACFGRGFQRVGFTRTHGNDNVRREQGRRPMGKDADLTWRAR